MQPRISAGAYFATGLGFVGFAVTFFFAAISGVWFWLGIVSSILAALCLYGAYREFYARRSAAPETVGYPQFMKTREQLRAEIAERDKKITELEGQLAELQGGQAYIEQHLADTRPRDIDVTIRAMFIHRVVTGQIPDAKQRHYTVCEIASASDSGRLSGQIYETLDHAGLMAELRRNGPAQRRHMYQELGTWVIGDAESEVVAELVSTLRSAGLIVTYLPWSAVLDPPPSNDFEVEIIVGDRGDALRDSVFDQSRSVGLG